MSAALSRSLPAGWTARSGKALAIDVLLRAVLLAAEHLVEGAAERAAMKPVECFEQDLAMPLAFAGQVGDKRVDAYPFSHRHLLGQRRHVLDLDVGVAHLAEGVGHAGGFLL